MMVTAELNHVRTHLVGMIYDEDNVQVLNEVERLLTMRRMPFDDAPCCYSSEELKRRVRQATASIREGKGVTVEEVKSLRPCFA
ncbi:MAG: hypothetical protein FWF09_05140 [Bacteroidales bacterium]|nr:hypothetical protein [Bacteroidales bacterium]